MHKGNYAAFLISKFRLWLFLQKILLAKFFLEKFAYQAA